MAKFWYALRVKPHKEKAVFQQLESQVIDLYFPQIKVKPKNPRANKFKPYFPGYMFLQADLDKVGQNAYSWIPGTLGLVSFGDSPAIVPNDLIVELDQKLSKLNEIQTSQLDIRKGERIRITEGPFAGFDAIFDMQLPGSERVQILLAFLSKHPHPIRLSHTAIEKMK
ncbi:MAG: transcription termination/antitermination NusG family protein [Chloroflexota bacterium]